MQNALFVQSGQQFDKLIARLFAAELFDKALFMLLPNRHHIVAESFTFRCHIKRLYTAIGLRFAAFGQSLSLKPVNHRNEIRTLNTQRLGHFALLEAGIVPNDQKNRKIGRPQTKLAESLAKILKNGQLRTAKMITDRVIENGIIDNAPPPCRLLPQHRQTREQALLNLLVYRKSYTI